MNCSLVIPALLALVATMTTSTRRGLGYFQWRSGFQVLCRGDSCFDIVQLSAFLMCQERENPGIVSPGDFRAWFHYTNCGKWRGRQERFYEITCRPPVRFVIRSNLNLQMKGFNSMKVQSSMGEALWATPGLWILFQCLKGKQKRISGKEFHLSNKSFLESCNIEYHN